MESLASNFEWYIAEISLPSPLPSEQPRVKLGPFVTEEEGRTVLESIKELPRFSHGNLELHKRYGRRSKRITMELSVHVRHFGADEKPQAAYTLDVSSSGARLGGLTKSLKLNTVVEILCGEGTAPFRVVWTGVPGTPTQDQVGVECLAPEANIWRLDGSQQSREEQTSREIDVARAVQNRLLPQGKPFLKTLDYAAKCIQVRGIGGDYYDFFDLGPKEVGFVLADISGKGVAAALLMANLQANLRSDRGASQWDLRRVLESANRHFYEHTDGNRYATVFFGCYNDATRKLSYVNCGHNAPLLLREATSVERLEATATVLGLFPDWVCSVAEVQLAPGDVLGIYSDGITEATNEREEEFGEARLLEILRSSRHLRASEIVRNAELLVKQFSRREQADDLTLLVTKAYSSSAGDSAP
jgi:Stage II sporulation protein E (SpoIIE)